MSFTPSSFYRYIITLFFNLLPKCKRLDPRENTLSGPIPYRGKSIGHQSVPVCNVPRNLGLLSRWQYTDTILTPILPAAAQYINNSEPSSDVFSQLENTIH